MKKFFMLGLTASLLFLMAGFVSAGPANLIQEIVISKNLNDGIDGVNIRVNVANDSAQAVQNPTITLWVRDNMQSDWKLIKEWSNHDAISPDHRLSHDYFANAEGTIEPEFLANNFEVKAEIWENGKLRDSFTKMHNQ